jgi:ketosteroid isomerase-like protein
MNARSARLTRLPIYLFSRRAVIAFLAVSTIGVSQLSGLAVGASSNQQQTLANLARNREEWVQYLHTKQLEPILKFYAPDAAFLQPNGDRITGSAALRSLFQNIMASFTSDLTLHSRNLEASGDLAYDSGDFEELLTNVATGAKIASKGSYVVIYKRQSDGSWKIVQHVWTGTPPAGT